jgi:uncharacterized protein (TIGR02246 family)
MKYGFAALATTLLLCSQWAHASPAPMACAVASQDDIAALFERWNHALQSGDPLLVAATYAPGSVLLPTVSNAVRLTHEQKADYFQHFLADKPSGKIDSRVIQTACNSAVDAGLYTFIFAASGKSVQARYTFTYGWDGAQWLITSHHSSAMPEG